MSKAFTRESDDAPDSPEPVRPSPLLPPGVKNYITPDGAQCLREELERLTQVERPALAKSADPIEVRRQLQSLDQRIQRIEVSLASAEIVQPSAGPVDRVRFGTTVTVRDRAGTETRYRIVGVDETDLDRNWVSWRSPIARSLLNARRGERVRFCFPSGEDDLEILEITDP